MGHLEAIVRITSICLVFFSIHSMLVTKRFKSLSERVLGRRVMMGWYRLSFTLISSAVLALCVWLVTEVPDVRIYYLPPWLRWPMHAVQLSALAFGYISYRQLNSDEFTGIAQARRYLTGEDLEGDVEGLSEGGLIRTGGYGVVRNPLYTAGIAMFVFHPHITRSWLTVSVLSVAYFVWGAWIEQKRMIGSFGNVYRDYMKEVPMLMPRPSAVLRWLRALWG
jgi:protein-S-isoprenylcysteine O-methyltransferase Ste14